MRQPSCYFLIMIVKFQVKGEVYECCGARYMELRNVNNRKYISTFVYSFFAMCLALTLRSLDAFRVIWGKGKEEGAGNRLYTLNFSFTKKVKNIYRSISFFPVAISLGREKVPCCNKVINFQTFRDLNCNGEQWRSRG